MIARRLRQVLLVAALAPAAAHAQQIAVRHYTVEDGLGNDTVGTAFQDRKGFLWFATAGGLSRFDGYRFVTYTREDGLGSDVVHKIDESATGELWVGTNAGLARFVETPGRGTFVTTPVGPDRGVSSFAIAPDGTIWCAQSDGIYRGVARENGAPDFTRVMTRADSNWRARVLRDRDGRVWISNHETLLHVDGTTLLPHREPSTDEPIRGLAQRPDGALLVARLRTISALSPGTTAADDRWQTVVTLGGDTVPQAIAVDPRNRIWIATPTGLVTAEPSGGHLTSVRAVSGHVAGVTDDRDGNIWATTFDKGVFKVNREPVVSYGPGDGFSDAYIATVVEGDGGRIYAVTRAGTYEVRPGGVVLLEGSTAVPFTSIGRKILYDGHGWWMWTMGGLYRVEGALDFRRSRRIAYAGPPFPADADGPSLAVGAAGAVWIATPTRGRALRASSVAPETTWATVSLDPRLVPPGSMVTSAAGALWMGTHSQLARLKDDTTQIFPAQKGLPDTFVRALFLDSRGWLWIGTFNGGVSVARAPDSPQPTFENYSPSQGLASRYVNSIAEDRFGRMYFVTGRGLDRLDPQTGQIRHLTTADGLAGTKVTYVMRDSRGHVWVGTSTGVSRLIPSNDDREYAPPPVIITGVRAAEEDVPVPPRGTREPIALRLSPSRANVQVEYVAVEFRGEQMLRYQFRLDGSGQPWSLPTESRSVIFGSLAPGTYGFRVRAISADGRPGPETTSLSFTILPPIWQRWWFVLLAIGAIGSTVFWVYRQRMNQLLAVERVRRQVALDLHDDVGAGLVQIAAMGELAAEDPRTGARLWPDVAAVARSLRDSMSDIVWAVDPSKDHLADLVQRLKDVAYASLEADGVAVTFDAPSQAEMARIQLATDRRRHVLLVLKEAVANIVRHAGATEVRVVLTVQGRQLRLVIGDNGRGFVPETGGAGNGLRSMRGRAAEAGGTIEILSTPGAGTTITLTVPA